MAFETILEHIGQEHLSRWNDADLDARTSTAARKLVPPIDGDGTPQGRQRFVAAAARRRGRRPARTVSPPGASAGRQPNLCKMLQTSWAQLAVTLYIDRAGWRILRGDQQLYRAMSTVTLDHSELSRTLGRFCGLDCTSTVVARTAIKAGLITLVLLMRLADAAAAGPFDDGQAAYDRGDYATALEVWRPLADHGDAAAEASLGAMYASGTGVPQDNAMAVTLYRKAADQGLAGAQHNLGVMYDYGRGLPQNYSAAVVWFRKAADQGHPDAQYNLGVMYADGRGVPRDFATAVMWYRKSADQGNASARSSLGTMYALGKGVQQDDVEAAAWFRKAAEQGHAGAQYNLGVMYADGRGVLRSLAMAVTWYREAADQGNAIAQSNLGAMYAEGRGVLQDYVLAYMWLSSAAASGNRYAERNRDIAAGHMTPAQIAEAERLTRERNLK
jgi:uncharacterized protein